MSRVTFGHANQATSRPTVHEEVLGELIFLLKSDHRWHGDIPALSKGTEQHRGFSQARAENRKYLGHDHIPNYIASRP